MASSPRPYPTSGRDPRRAVVDRDPPSGGGRIGERRGRGDPSGDDDPADDWGTAAGAGARDWGRARHGREDLRRRDAPRSSEATARGAPRQQPADTHVSQEQRDAAGGGHLVRSCRFPPPATVAGIESRIAIGWAGPPAVWGGYLFCGHDAEAPHGACAACSLWRGLQNTRLPCGHQPDDTRPMNCDVCCFYFEDLDERRGHPRLLECGQPAAAPILRSGCPCCCRAGRTHGSTDFLFCGHTMERPGRDCPSCQARQTVLDMEGRTHVLHEPHSPDGAAAGNRSWSAPNRYDVMTGNFGTDGPLETELREGWLDAIRDATGFDPRRLLARGSDRSRRASRTIEQGGRSGRLRGSTSQGRAPRAAEQGGQGEVWVRDTHPCFEDRSDRAEGRAGRRTPCASGRRRARWWGTRPRHQPPLNRPRALAAWRRRRRRGTR